MKSCTDLAEKKKSLALHRQKRKSFHDGDQINNFTGF
jgi:hypothetical protein